MYTMSKPNPFEQTMTRLSFPPGMGTCISVAGFTVEADEQGAVTVPKEHVPVLKAHGLVDFVEPGADEGAAKKKK
jgi:hypothetical protein